MCALKIILHSRSQDTSEDYFAVFFALTTHSFAAAEVVGACGNHHSRSASEESYSDARECIEQSCDHFSLHFCPRSGITRCIFTKLFLINHHFSMPFLMFFGIKMRMKFMEKCECIFSILVRSDGDEINQEFMVAR